MGNAVPVGMNGFTDKEIAALKPGDSVRFGQTTYGHVNNWLEGVVLAIGATIERGSSRKCDGAVVAWHDRYPHEGYPAASVSFTPFWNQRFQPARTK